MKLPGSNAEAQKREDHALIFSESSETIHQKIITILLKFGNEYF